MAWGQIKNLLGINTTIIESKSDFESELAGTLGVMLSVTAVPGAHPWQLLIQQHFPHLEVNDNDQFTTIPQSLFAEHLRSAYSISLDDWEDLCQGDLSFIEDIEDPLLQSDLLALALGIGRQEALAKLKLDDSLANTQLIIRAIHKGALSIVKSVMIALNNQEKFQPFDVIEKALRQGYENIIDFLLSWGCGYMVVGDRHKNLVRRAFELAAGIATPQLKPNLNLIEQIVTNYEPLFDAGYFYNKFLEAVKVNAEASRRGNDEYKKIVIFLIGKCSQEITSVQWSKLHSNADAQDYLYAFTDPKKLPHSIGFTVDFEVDSKDLTPPNRPQQ